MLCLSPMIMQLPITYYIFFSSNHPTGATANNFSDTEILEYKTRHKGMLEQNETESIMPMGNVMTDMHKLRMGVYDNDNQPCVLKNNDPNLVTHILVHTNYK